MGGRREEQVQVAHAARAPRQQSRVLDRSETGFVKFRGSGLGGVCGSNYRALRLSDCVAWGCFFSGLEAPVSLEDCRE